MKFPSIWILSKFNPCDESVSDLSKLYSISDSVRLKGEQNGKGTEFTESPGMLCTYEGPCCY